MNVLATIFFGIRETFKNAWYVLLFVAVSFLVFFLFVLIPTISVPGNNILFQLSLFAPLDFVITIVLSALYALFVAMQVFVIQTSKKMKGVGATLSGGASALFAGIVGTAFCASCLAPLFAIFGIGFGGVIFVLEYRFYFVAGITLLMLIAIYLTARKINKVCTSC